MSLSTYTATPNALDEGEEPQFVELPTYTVPASSGAAHVRQCPGRLDKLADLVSKRIGMPEVQLTACMWQRGILADKYG